MGTLLARALGEVRRKALAPLVVLATPFAALALGISRLVQTAISATNSGIDSYSGISKPNSAPTQEGAVVGVVRVTPGVSPLPVVHDGEDQLAAGPPAFSGGAPQRGRSTPKSPGISALVGGDRPRGQARKR